MVIIKNLKDLENLVAELSETKAELVAIKAELASVREEIYRSNINRLESDPNMNKIMRTTWDWTPIICEKNETL